MWGIIQNVVIGILSSIFGITKSGTTLTLGSASDTVSIPGTLSATLSVNSLVGAANTTNAITATDGTTTLLAVDTRIGITGVKTFAFAPPAALSFAGAAGNTYNLVSYPAFTLTQTGSTGVTAFSGLSLNIGSPTVTDASALTVTDTSTVDIAPPIKGGSVSFTRSRTLNLKMPTGGSTNIGLSILASGGTVGNDEGWISHDGTYFRFFSPDTDGLIGFAGSNGTGTPSLILKADNFGGNIAAIFSTSGTNKVCVSASGDAGQGVGLTSDSYLGWTSSTSDARVSQYDTRFTRLAAAVIGTQGASAAAGWLQNTAGTDRVNAAAVTSTDTTPVNITALSKTVIAGRKYVGSYTFFANNSTNTDGLSFDLGGGSATFTSLKFGLAAQPAGSTLGTVTSTTSTTPITLTIVSTSDAVYTVSFGFVCNGAGTVIPRVYEVVDGGGTATVQIQSFVLMEDSPS